MTRQGDPQNLHAAVTLVEVVDESNDAGPRLIGDTRDGRHAERGGDRRDRVDDWVGHVGAVQLELQDLD